MKLSFKTALLASCAVLAGTISANARTFDIPKGNLEQALDAYMAQTGLDIVVSTNQVEGVRSQGAKGDLADNIALARILSGTGFVVNQHPGGAIAVVRMAPTDSSDAAPVTRLAEAAPAHAAASVETVVVTSSKIKGDIQTVPIAITALSQEQLTSRQIAGGPDLVKEVPNLTFTKTNFSGYSIQIRGIGTQAISVTTDPAVAVALNDIPFIRNHFFEQEFFDLNQAEVLRGPQGTLYGRNATAGVVNLISAKPTDQFEAMLSADWGNYTNRRYEGMINIPITDDRLDLRVAAEWTKRDGYSFNQTTGTPIDGRDLWSSRVTLGWKPVPNAQVYLVWEHFQESDDRLRSGKQLCKHDSGPSQLDGVPIAGSGPEFGFADYLSQGCLPASLYSPESFQTPNGESLSYIAGLNVLGFSDRIDPYASETQSRNLRVIESTLTPSYKAKDDIVELNADFAVTPALTFTSQTGFNRDFLYSTEDYNRFNTRSDVWVYRGPADPYPNTTGAQPFVTNRGQISPDGNYACFDGTISIGAPCPRTADGSYNGGSEDPTGTFCDPQLGCTSKLVGEDLDEEKSWQFSQEFRLSSNFSGPFNFSIGGNYLHYETDENYYVFINALTLIGSVVESTAMPPWQAGVSDNHECADPKRPGGGGYYHFNPAVDSLYPLGCDYIDPNPISTINGNGHNYFRSNNPYVLNSYAGFGEAYVDIEKNLKLTTGLRWTDDRKHFQMIPSFLLVPEWGTYVQRDVDQQWNQWTGRAALDWTPKLDFTDQTLVYASFAHGYKAGGANPPGAILLQLTQYAIAQPVHPLTFEPEFINAYELGTKNTLADGAITLNGDVFYYDYKGYQISQIVDRTSVNLNFDAKIDGAEIEASYEPLPGLKFNFAGGYENTRINNGQSAIDLMDRTAGHSDWVVLKPGVGQASNCIIPTYVVADAVASGQQGFLGPLEGEPGSDNDNGCDTAYSAHYDPLTNLPFTPNPTVGNGTYFQPRPGYPGFDPVDPNATNNGAGPAPNNGEGFAKDLGGNQLPNAPHFTTSLSAEYTVPLSEDWAATLHSDFYWQSQSWARVFNDVPYDKLRGYSNVNLALIVTSADGWQVMGYLKNVFDTTAITGDFLNSDDSGLTTNVFLTDPRLFGVRVTKNW